MFIKLMDAEAVCIDNAGHFCDGDYDKSFEEILPYLDCLNLEAGI